MVKGLKLREDYKNFHHSDHSDNMAVGEVCFKVYGG